MKTFSILTGLTALIASASAAVAAQKTFSLATTSTDSRFNNLCVIAYHTGAGTADAVLAPCDSSSTQFFINGTTVQSTAFGAGATAGFQAIISDSYDDWYPATIIAGYGTPLSYSKARGFMTQSNTGFLGCRWAHGGAPQLFVFAYETDQNISVSTCAAVGLVKKFA